MITKQKLDELRHEATIQVVSNGPPSVETLETGPVDYAEYVIRSIDAEDHLAVLRMLLEDECKRNIREAARELLRMKLNL